MDTKTALSTAGALVLVVAGGASALAAGRSAPAAQSGAATEGTTVTTIITEYVDTDGNPVAPPGNSPTVEVRSIETDGGFILLEAVEPEIIWVDAPTTTGVGGASRDGYEDVEYDDDEYEDHDDEYEDHDDDEYEDHDDEDHEDEDEDEDDDDH